MVYHAVLHRDNSETARQMLFQLKSGLGMDFEVSDVRSKGTECTCVLLALSNMSGAAYRGSCR